MIFGHPDRNVRKIRPPGGKEMPGQPIRRNAETQHESSLLIVGTPHGAEFQAVNRRRASPSATSEKS